MDPLSQVELTAVMNEARGSRADARNRLVRAVYDELRRMADGMMRRKPRPHAATERIGQRGADPTFRRRCSHAGQRPPLPVRRRRPGDAPGAGRPCSRRNASKRTGGKDRVPLDDALAYFEEQQLDVLALNEAVDRLMKLNERQGLTVTLRFFAGLSVPEVAQALDVSVATVEGDWQRGASVAPWTARSETILTPERWQRVTDLFSAALTVRPR